MANFTTPALVEVLKLKIEIQSNEQGLHDPMDNLKPQPE